MISHNSSVYKLNASKSSRDVEPYDYCPSDETYENSSIDGEIGDTNNRYHGGSREGRYNNRSGVGRSRSTEFRSSKVNDKRSGYRGRGRETSSRRNDRDYSDNFYNMRKYESRNSESNANHRGKFYEPEKKTEIKLNLPEDTRISKLLRRLNIETNQENSLVISKKLLEVLLLPDNAPYVRKAFHILGESMHEILHLSPGPLAKRQAARALGRMGYIMAQENDFERYQNWLFAKMNNSYEEMQILLISTFKETLDMEIKKPMLENHIESLITNLVTAIETTENAEVFKTILEILVSVVEVYPSEFYSQFRDTIDLLFGWHVDHTQPLSNIEFISVSLQRLSHHFKYHIDFSVSLIENFLEDITNYATEVAESLDHVTVLILAMNTVLKCLQTAFHPSMNKTVKTEFVTMGITRIIKTLTDALQQFVPDNLIIAANECISLLLQYLDTKPQSICNSIFALVDLEMSVINEMSDKSIITMLLLISKVIKELSANLPIELIEKLIGPKSDIVKLRSSPYSDIQNSVICVYQSLLNLKNVSLLQEAYRYVLGDLEVTYKKIIPGFQPFVQNNPFSAEELEIKNPELTVLFLLRCLSQLANASSIIVMWALKPSFLELVGSNLKPYSSDLAKTTPYLQYSLLYLLYSHCKCYNHFISNSSLVTNKEEQNTLNRFALTEGLNINDVPNTSPNSGNFAIILDTLYQTLKIETSTEVTLLLLQWLNDILVNSENYLETLYLNDKFATVTNVLVKCGYHFNSKIVQAVGDNLEKLLSNKQLAWNNSFLTNVSDVCKLHMNSNNKEIRDQYSKLSANIPWDVAVVEFNKINAIYNIQHKSTNSKDFNNYMIYLAQTLHLNGTVDGEMYPQQFKNFMDYLLSRNTIPDNFLEEIFSCCWVLESESQMNMELFYDLAINSREVLNNWATLEAAQFCVNYKLRTPLGKPNETFTKIESVLHQLGNDLIVLKRSNAKPADTNGNRVRMLLHFVAHLEKSIYNAAEGTAMAMLTPSKNVRSFFIANLNTCNEWLARIRMVIMHIALHSGESAIALRHGQSMLKDLCSAGKADTTEFERVAMFVSIALLNLKEPEALYGLYCWCKAETSKRYTWIRCASEQASKKYEIAVEGYKKILQEAKSEKEDKKLDSDVTNFICDQIEVCYKELNNWVELFDWHSTHQEGATENGKKYWFNISDWDCNKNLFDFETNPQALAALSSWSIRDEQPSWSMYDNLMTTETNLYNIALNLASNTEQNFVNSLDKSLETIQKSVQDHLILAPSEFLQNYALLQYVATGLKNVANGVPAHTVFLVSENFENEINKIDSSVLRKILWWSEYFGRVQNQGFNIFCSNLRLDIIKRARKEKNFKLACTNVVKFFRDKEILLSSQSDIGSIVSELNEKITDVNMWTIDTARAISEVIKLSYTNDDDKQNTFNLCAIASREISKYAEMFGGIEQRKISSKILIKVAGWLQPNESYNITEMSSPLGQLIMVLPEIGMMENTVSTNIIPLHEMAVGKLLQFSVHQCVTLAKGWNAFGTWCYRWGKKIVDHTSDVKNNLTDEHCLEIKQLLPPEASEEDVTKVYLILSQTRSIIDEEDIDSNEINTSDMIKNQLQAVPILFNATEDTLKSLVQIWKSTQRRIYSYYALSAEAYFKYLHLSLNNDNVTNNTECDTITITLRLLRLIVKYALELQTILEEGLQTTPTQPWKVIIPQLFSRLNHPECYVRHRVSDLLCRVAEDAPQLITFPAVVGALEGGLKFDFSEITLPKDCLSQTNECVDDAELNDDEDNDESDAEESYSNSLQTCFKTMVDTLSKQDPDTIAQVQTLVKELRRITLLWDELWLGTLAQHQSEIMKRQQQLEYEIEKVNENVNLSKEEKTSLILEKHRIIIKPIVYVLEQLKDVTSSEPETPHEKHFQDKYMSDINDVIHTLKQPDNPDKPSDSLQPLRSLQKKFQQKFHKRASYSLKMSDISPVLHAMKNTLIAMPGLAVAKKNNVTISHISNVVSILPTKTKPKKLVFYGSDGQTYTYLFKGLEDLHLDERIMQFLSIANTMMAQNADPAGHNLYRARHYSVIPLGPRSGLISWVDGTTPVFALYKRWQQREIAKPTAKGTATSNASVLRPSELFYNKLVEHGVKNIDNRKEWPLSVLKQVLTELMAETPSDLLAKELWCNAISANVWWQVVKRYSYSVAVMSIIGYIIGLGDRHLDNMLVDLTTGDVVHIDYNVCFEKGKTLRVPEKVPFRLTPNIRGALGVTGVEGIFRLACENVLKTMRKGRETLLTLLEAFVYDPLVDWTVGGEVLAGTSFGGISTNNSSRQTKKDLEKEVTLAMFNVRCTEIKTEWSENKDEIITEISSLTTILNGCVELTNEASETEDQLHDLHHQLSIVKEAEAQSNKKHSLYKLPHLYEAYTKSQDAMNTAKNDLHSMIKQCDSQIQEFNNLVSLYEKQQFSQWLVEVKPNINEDSMHVFDLLKEFLHKAGKDDVVAQCEESEQEVAQFSQHLNIQIRKCTQLLQDFFTLLIQSPKSYMTSHKIHLFRQWALFLLETRSLEGCNIVYDNFRSLIETKNQNSQQILNVWYALDACYKDTLVQVNKLFDDLAALRTKDTNTSLEKLYNNAKVSVSTFLQSEKGAANALKFVIAGELLLLNRNMLTQEITASKSGDWLINLTSRDGAWFLDDLVMHSRRAVELIGNVPYAQDADDNRFYQIMNGIRIANNIYKGIYDLNFNFQTIILPESIKKIQADEESVLQMIVDVNNLVNDGEVCLQELIGHFEVLLTCVLMQMDVATVSFDKVTAIKTKFLSLLTSQTDTLSQGQMLLMGFNGLFEKLTQETNNLVSSLSHLDIPKSWKKLDHVKDAKSIAPHIFNPQVRDILENIFFLKRIQTISEFFALAQKMCMTVKGVNNTPVVIYTDELLTKPVKKFIAEYISRQLLGITPETITYGICMILQSLHLDVTREIEQRDIGAESKVPLDELYHKAYNVLIKDGTAFTSNVLAQASSLETNLKVAWDKIQEPKKIEQKLAVLQSSALRIQSQLAVYNLINGELLSLNNIPSVRAKFVLDMQSELGNLQTVYKELSDARERQQKLIEKAHQRLNWAKGANPNVIEISAAFENAVKLRDEQLTVEQNVANNVFSCFNIVIRHELLRSTTLEASKDFDKLFFNTYEKWKLACQYTDSKIDNLQPTEENILHMLTPEVVKDPKWLDIVSNQITDAITLYQNKLTEKKELLFLKTDNLLSIVNNFKCVYSVQTKLMSEVKSLIKTMTKIEEYAQPTQHFVTEYRDYTEHFTLLFKAFKEHLDKNRMSEIMQHLNYIADNTADIYEGLLNLQEKKFRPPLRRQSCVSGIAAKKQDSVTKGQQRNAYAVNVWRRVKMKLEGRDPDAGRKYTAQEQVDYVIREATNLDNLALLYEGWTPWV